MTLPAGPFDVICADPPWNFKGNSVAAPGRNARRHYSTMSLDEIAALPVADVVAPDAALFMWITGPFLAIGAHLPIMKAWGFKPSGVAFTWVKLNQRAPGLFWQNQDLFTGGGLTTRKNAEVCLLGKRGRSLRQSASVREVIVSPRREHSRKPEEFRERVEQYVGPERRILEMFSRSSRAGWTGWGNETEKFDEVAA